MRYASTIDWNKENLLDFLQVEVTIECSRCRALDGDCSEDDYYLLDRGWRSFGDYCYCPKCVKELKKICRGTNKRGLVTIHSIKSKGRDKGDGL